MQGTQRNVTHNMDIPIAGDDKQFMEIWERKEGENRHIRKS
jgi:hypothetical protein